MVRLRERYPRIFATVIVALTLITVSTSGYSIMNMLLEGDQKLEVTAINKGKQEVDEVLVRMQLTGIIGVFLVNAFGIQQEDDKKSP